jgi:hypothetical protein
MVYDLRTFTVKSGRFSEYIEIHKKVAVPILLQYLGEPVGYWSSITGEMNEFIHLWRFEDFADMERRHTALNSDPAWRDYITNDLGSSEILQRQQSKLLRPIDIPKLKQG